MRERDDKTLNKKNLRLLKQSLISSLIHKIRKLHIYSTTCLKVASKIRINIHEDKYYHTQLKSILSLCPVTNCITKCTTTLIILVQIALKEMVRPAVTCCRVRTKPNCLLKPSTLLIHKQPRFAYTFILQVVTLTRRTQRYTDYIRLNNSWHSYAELLN